VWCAAEEQRALLDLWRGWLQPASCAVLPLPRSRESPMSCPCDCCLSSHTCPPCTFPYTPPYPPPPFCSLSPLFVCSPHHERGPVCDAGAGGGHWGSPAGRPAGAGLDSCGALLGRCLGRPGTPRAPAGEQLRAAPGSRLKQAASDATGRNSVPVSHATAVSCNRQLTGAARKVVQAERRAATQQPQTQGFVWRGLLLWW
jgi:hypothetical protein